MRNCRNYSRNHFFFCLRYVFTIFYTGSFQAPPKKNHHHLKCQFPPKIPIDLSPSYMNFLKDDSAPPPHHPGGWGAHYVSPVTAPEMKISRKWKNSWRYHHFTHVHQKSWSHVILLLRYGTWRRDIIVIFYFGLFFALLPPNLPKKWKFKKKWKKPWSYHHVTQVYQKSWSYPILFLRYSAWRM